MVRFLVKRAGIKTRANNVVMRMKEGFARFVRAFSVPTLASVVA